MTKTLQLNLKPFLGKMKLKMIYIILDVKVKPMVPMQILFAFIKVQILFAFKNAILDKLSFALNHDNVISEFSFNRWIRINRVSHGGNR